MRTSRIIVTDANGKLVDKDTYIDMKSRDKKLAKDKMLSLLKKIEEKNNYLSDLSLDNDISYEDMKKAKEDRDMFFQDFYRIFCEAKDLPVKTETTTSINTNIREEEYTTDDFCKCIIVQDKREKIMYLLHSYIDGQTKPKGIMRPIRAAMEATLISRPDMKLFNKTFEKQVSKTSFNKYSVTELIPEEYLQPKDMFWGMVEEFKKIKDKKMGDPKRPETTR